MSTAGLGAEAIRRSLATGERWILRTRGRSMAPLLPSSCQVSLRPLRHDEPRRGDVVLVEAGGMLLLHRTIEVSDTRIVTRGDNTAAADTAVPRAAVIARADRFYRPPIGWLPMPSGRTALVGVRSVRSLRRVASKIRRRATRGRR